MNQMPMLDLSEDDSSRKSTGEDSSRSNLSSPTGSPTGKKIPRKNSNGSPRTFFPSGHFSVEYSKSLGSSPTFTIVAFEAKNPNIPNATCNSEIESVPRPKI